MDFSSDASNKSGKKKKGKPILKKLLIILLILGLLSGGGFFGYLYLHTKQQEVIPKSDLPEEILRLTYKIMPEIHADVVTISEEIIFTENEIKRIENIEKKNPDQKKITDTEKKLWDKNLKELNKFRLKHEKEIRDIYVSYRVNTETGLKLIDEKKEELKKSSNEVLKPSKKLTDKIRAIEEAKSFMDKLKEKVFK